MISSIPFAMAAIPLATYLIMLGAIRLRRRPLVTTGWRDLAALGIALIGLVAIGPVQLFFPTYASARFSGWVWGMLLMLYLLGLLLIMLSCRPRLIIYGLEEEPFYRILRESATHIDPQANWHGQILTMPSAGLQLVSEPTGSRGVQQATSVSGPASIPQWMQLERELVRRCASERASQQRTGAAWLIGGGLLLIVWPAQMIMSDPAQALIELRQFFIR